jgi:hypothetical protein
MLSLGLELWMGSRALLTLSLLAAHTPVSHPSVAAPRWLDVQPAAARHGVRQQRETPDPLLILNADPHTRARQNRSAAGCAEYALQRARGVPGGDAVPCLDIPACPSWGVVSSFKNAANASIPAVQQTVVSVCYNATGLVFRQNATDEDIFNTVGACNGEVFEGGDVLCVAVGISDSQCTHSLFVFHQSHRRKTERNYLE